MPISPHSPRRQRRAVYNADTFERRLRMTVPLSRELRSRFHRRSVPLRKGDTVRVMKGSFVGREERVAKIDRRGYTVTLDNVTLKSGEEKLKPLPVRTNHLLIVRLNLADAWRRESLKVREEEVTPEERGEVPEVAEGEAPAPTVDAPAAPSTPTAAAPKGEPKALPTAGAAAEPKAPAKKARKPKAPASETPEEEE
ncbi:MAG: 50S ribosomal protein L24 [Thermoplasmata archaeon]